MRVDGHRIAPFAMFVSAAQLPWWSKGPQSQADVVSAAADAGYEGFQLHQPALAHTVTEHGLAIRGLGRADTASAVDRLACTWSEIGADSVSVHLGTGFERDPEANRLVESLLEAQQRRGIEMLLETHRATITQDPARTIGLAEKFPELRFTSDLSHWYTGVEMRYGDFERKLELISSVLSRVRMTHGRIGDPGCVQVTVDAADRSLHVADFRRMWTRSFAGHISDPMAATDVVFAPELLPSSMHYARTVRDPADGQRREESDRWEQALVLIKIARECLQDAIRNVEAAALAPHQPEGAVSQR